MTDTLWPWHETVDWWREPATAYLRGLQDGAQMERERREREDEALWRQAVRGAIATIERADARRRADAGVGR